MSEKALESREQLIQYLEQVSGRSIRTREDIKAYVEEMSARKAADDPSVRWWQKAKTVMLAVLTVSSLMQYYLMDVLVQVVSLRETTFFVPVSTPAVVKSLRETPPQA